MSSFTLPEELYVVTSLTPAADAAGRNGTGISLKNALKAYIVVIINQGNAATVLLTPQQCTAVAGTGAKAIPATRIWFVTDAATSSVPVRQTDAASFTTDAGVKTKKVIFEIDPAKLDVAGGFDCIRIVTGASNAANITAAEIVMVPAYPGAAMPEVITD